MLKKADVVVGGAVIGGKVRVDVEYEDNEIVKERESSWRSDLKTWLLDITELPEVRRDERWYMSESARQLYEELKIGPHSSARKGAQLLGEEDGKYMFDLQYPDRKKIRKIEGAFWDKEKECWKLPSDIEITDALPKYGLQPLISGTQIIEVTDDYLLLSYRGELKHVPYHITEEEDTLGEKEKILCLPKDGEFNRWELDTQRLERLEEFGDYDELRFVPESKLVTYGI